MAEILFISQNYLKQNSIINDNTDFEMLEPTIVMVQDVYIQNLLGTALFEDLKSKLATDVTLATEPLYKGLLDNYISKIMLWYILMESTPSFKFRYMNAGVVEKNGDGFSSTSRGDLMWLMDKWRLNAERYSELLTKYLIDSIGLFPKYSEVINRGVLPNDNSYNVSCYLDDYDEQEKNKWCLPRIR